MQGENYFDDGFIAEISIRRPLRISLRNLKYEILNLVCALIGQIAGVYPTEQNRLSILRREFLVLIVRCSGYRRDAH